MPFSDILRVAKDHTHFEAVDSDSEDEFLSYDQVTQLSHSFIIPPSRRHSSMVHRRSSVRSKISFNAPLDSTDVFLDEDYSSDPTKRSINDFKEVNVLGIGSYGRVYLVKDVHNGKLFAKKTINKAKISVNEKVFKTHKNERDILAKISHPNIVKLFYSFHDHEKIDFILEYIPGGEIFYHLSSRSRFNEDETAFYLAEISLALKHLHELGVVYRDLKPENVLLNSEGHVVLTDFGLSSQEETCNSILGTPEFTAPEVLKGESYSYPADWWSFGIMMFDMLTGDTPFTGNNKKTLFNKITTKKIIIPFYLSQDAKDLLFKLTNKNPQKRMKIDDDFTKFRKHRFFRKINWDKIEESQPPIVPNIDDLEKAENFNHDYIREVLEKTEHVDETRFDNEIFKGFSFIATTEVLEG